MTHQHRSWADSDSAPRRPQNHFYCHLFSFQCLFNSPRFFFSRSLSGRPASSTAAAASLFAARQADCHIRAEASSILRRRESMEWPFFVADFALPAASFLYLLLLFLSLPRLRSDLEGGDRKDERQTTIRAVRWYNVMQW